MFGSAILEVAIGLVFVFLIFSLLLTTILEMISNFFQMRAKNLKAALKQMLGDQNSESFLNHPLIQSISMPQFLNFKTFAPSYIQPTNFARAVISMAQNSEDCAQVSIGPQAKDLRDYVSQTNDVDSAKKAIRSFTARQPQAARNQLPQLNALTTLANNIQVNTPEELAAQTKALTKQMELQQIQAFTANLNENNADGTLKKVVTNSINTVGADAAKLQKDLEAWFDRSMQQASGWYKKKIGIINVCVTLVIVAAFNVDALHISNRLYQDPTMRQTLVAQAENFQPGDVNNPKFDEIKNEIEQAKSIGLPIGWKFTQSDVNSGGDITSVVIYKILGLLVSFFAISLGAPFWFDTLNKFMRLRTQLKLPSEPESEK